MLSLSRSFSALLFLILATLAHAQDLGAVRQRMNERLPVLDALRSQGAIGEDNRGFTEVREPVEKAAEISTNENRDRGVVYAAIAKQTGSTPEQVGRARARQIAGSAAAGVWLQRENGEWYRK